MLLTHKLWRIISSLDMHIEAIKDSCHLNSVNCFQVRVENVKDPADHIDAVLERVRKEYLQRTYQLPSTDEWNNAEEFLSKIALRSGRLLKVRLPNIIQFSTEFESILWLNSFLGRRTGFAYCCQNGTERFSTRAIAVFCKTTGIR